MDELRSRYEISAELFAYELYDSGWRFRFDVPWDYKGAFAPLIAKHLVGWCDACRLLVRPRSNEFAVMCEVDGEKFWFHVLPVTLDCIIDKKMDDLIKTNKPTRRNAV